MARGAAVVLIVLLLWAIFAVPAGVLVSSGAPLGPSHLGSVSRGPLGLAGTTNSSYNWAGYAVLASAGQVTSVSASWVEPAVTCRTLALAAFWVGIDGATASAPSVEQTGTIAECIFGVVYYDAWWELYPTNGVQTFASVSAGDSFSASVTYTSATGIYTMSITDVTSGTTWSTSGSQSAATSSTAECIAEAPAGDAATSSTLYPLANFGTVAFNSCSATIAGTSGGIGSFSGVERINMVSDPTGAHKLAATSKLTAKSSFTVTWKHAT